MELAQNQLATALEAARAGHAAEPASPCVRNCCLDENDICLGCGRALEEILRWQQSSPGEREAILVAARQRVEIRRARWES